MPVPKFDNHRHTGIDKLRVSYGSLEEYPLVPQAVQSGVTAATGSTQATGVLITQPIVEISVSANAGDSVKLPKIITGMQIIITNHGANSVDVFPNVGGFINEAAVNTAKAVAANATLLCIAYDSNNWEALTLAR